MFCWFWVFASVPNAPGGTGHASPERLSCPLLPPSRCSVRWCEVGPGGGLRGAVARAEAVGIEPTGCAAQPAVECPGPPLRPAGR